MRRGLAALVTVVIVLGVNPAASGAERQRDPATVGRPLADVLRDLQARGLKVVFSSELVRPGMRVQVEPKGADDREKLDSLLKPHGLVAQPGPGGTLLVVRRRPARETAVPLAAPGHGTIRGTVVDARSATPLPGVLITLPGTEREAVTDDNGWFELTEVAAGAQTIFVSLVGYALARPTLQVPAGSAVEVSIALADGTGTYSEAITVTADRFRGTADSAPAAMVLNSTDLLELRGVLTDDPFRAVQALPGAMTGNDYRSEFSVRGSDYGHIGLSIDGVSTGWPIHTVRADQGGGSVALINSDIVDHVALMAGAYPQEQPARTGAWLDMSIREGSRARTQAHGALSMTSASLVVEGPLGAARGSWLVSARQSYVQWIVQRIDPENDTSFGFSDLQGKVVFDVTPREQLQFTVVAGRSLLDQAHANPDEDSISRGSARANLFVLAWRSTRGSATTITHRLAGSGYAFRNDSALGTLLADGSGAELSYRGAVAWSGRRGTFIQAGTHLRRVAQDALLTTHVDALDGSAPAARTERVDASASSVSGDARVSQTIARGLWMDGGALVTHSTVGGSGTTVSPWMTARLSLGPYTVRAGGGVYRQLPTLDQTAGTFGRPHVRAERAGHFDVALERAVRPDTRVQVAFYDRQERDVLRLESNEYRLVDGTIVPPSLDPVWANALRGSSRGAEVLAQRRSATGLSGWVSYAYSRTRYDDIATGETFAGDFDQRHTFNAYAQYRVSPVTSLSAKLRVGSNFPVPGYLERRNGDLFVGAARNLVRLPRYARLDLRANRAFNFDTRRLTLFVEIVNVLGRANSASDTQHVLPDGRVVGATQSLFPFLPTAGILVDF